MSGKKTTSTTKPIYSGQIEGAANTLGSTYQQQAPKIAAVSDSLTGLVPGMIDKYKAGNPALNAASDYVTTTLGSDATNPNLDAWIGQEQNAAENRLGAKLAKMGLNPAGSTYQGVAGREVAKVGLGARMTDWDNAQTRKAQAASMAPGIAAGDVIQVAPMLATAQLGANLPMDAAFRYAAGTGGLLGQYNTTTQKQSPGLMDWIGMGLQGASLFSDKRLKTDIRKVGKTDDGLGVYTYKYKGDATTHMGVMAQEVEKKQPGALGARVSGFRTVNYEEVR